MTDSIERNKLVRKLIKIISEKQTTIEKLKKNAKNQEKELNAVQTNKVPIFDERLKHDITATSLEVKQIQEKLQLMEERIGTLTEALNEEVSINTSNQEKIKLLEEKQQTYRSQLNQLSLKIEKLQKEKAQLLETNAVLLLQNKNIKSKMEEFKIQQEYQRLLETKISNFVKSEQQNRRFQKRIGECIDNMHDKFCKNNIKKSIKEKKANDEDSRIEDLSLKLDQLENILKETYEHPHGDVLNETLDGFSIIMKSFQEKLEGVTCLTERRNTCETIQQKNQSSNCYTLPTKGDNSTQKIANFDRNQKEEANRSI